MNKQSPYGQQRNFWQRCCSPSRRIHIGIGCSLLIALCLLTSCAGANNSPTIRITPTTNQMTQSVTPIPTSRSTSTVGSGITHHYEYVFPDGSMYVYDMDNGHALIKTISLPTMAGVRGIVASPVNGIDSMAIAPDGKTIYMPDGELTSDGTWYVVDANTGNETGTINGGTGPHNTIVSLNGKHVYLGGRNHHFLEVADTATNQVIKNIGPLLSGVRPFTINGKETLAYISTTGFLGFQVGDITTGKVLYTMPIRGFSWDGNGPSDPSHGISLSPDEKELYVIDWPNNYVHVFDVSNDPASAPRQVADIQLTRSIHHNETPCAYDCLADGWLQHSRDGRFVYVGDEGDVIDTATRKVVTNLDTLYNSRKMLEIDWQDGVPIFTTSRSGVGYVTN